MPSVPLHADSHTLYSGAFTVLKRLRGSLRTAGCSASAHFSTFQAQASDTFSRLYLTQVCTHTMCDTQLRRGCSSWGMRTARVSVTMSGNVPCITPLSQAQAGEQHARVQPGETLRCMRQIHPLHASPCRGSGKTAKPWRPRSPTPSRQPAPTAGDGREHGGRRGGRAAPKCITLPSIRQDANP